ncbi:MAG: tRNA guanosine(34) transglycosylase Tgt [Candidatus Dormibacteraeota bacterium]|nr:tRNA guanosine(34) transglycosylase Tgt [Candidatus Dormibacteraeota bacterium]
MSAFRIQASDGAARTGELTTLHGPVRTPAFMPVGTHATVKALDPSEVRASGADILLCNAYHLALRPGVELIERAGGLHSFMGWDRAILSDSGGYQLVSLRNVTSVDDGGAVFVSPYDGSRLRVTPEDAVGIQHRLGSDVIMCLDHPVPFGASMQAVEDAARRTAAWAERCRSVHPGGGRLLFGIAKGGFDAELRHHSAQQIATLDFDGNAVCGLSVGEPLPLMEEMTAASLSALPPERPRYFMGLGTDRELLTMIGLGVDMFDCVVPTRLARNGTALTPSGHLSLRGAAAQDDLSPIDPTCACAACSRFSRAYLRHLFKSGEILAHRLVSLHNLTHLGRLMDQARDAIQERRFAAFRRTAAALADAGGVAEPG